MGCTLERICTVVAFIFGIIKGDEVGYIITKKKDILDIEDDRPDRVYMDQGVEVVEMPSFNDKELLIEKLRLNRLKKLSIIAISVQNGYYNIVTDKKGIWGLTKQADGLYKNSFLSSNGKIYMGITDKKIEFQDVDKLCYIFEIFIPKQIEILFDLIYNVFYKERELLFYLMELII